MVKLPKQIVLVRHGQSRLNVAKVKTGAFFDSVEKRAEFAGQADQHIALTELGVRQAEETGRALAERGFRFDRAYDSGYERTARTRELLLGAYPDQDRERVRLVQDLRLRERECGYTFFMTKAEVDAQFPWLEEYWRTTGPLFARPLGGESVADVVIRVGAFLREMFADAAGERVLISTHGRVLLAVRHILEGWTWQQMEAVMRKGGFRNCGVTTYDLSADGTRLGLSEFNTCHWRSDAPVEEVAM